MLIVVEKGVDVENGNGYDDGDKKAKGDGEGKDEGVLFAITSLTGVGIDNVIGFDTATDGTNVG